MNARAPYLRSLSLMALAVAGALTFAAPALADKVVARVDGMEITEKDLEIATEDLGDRLQQVPASQRREYLIGFMADLRESKKALTPEAARKLFDDTIKTLTPEEEVRARHILVEKQDEAKAALARLRKGEDFAKVAAELSKDPGSGKEGGDLGYFTKDRMVPPFAEAAFKLKAGELSEPVQTQFGWHVIKLEDRRTRALPKFEEVKGEIETYIVRGRRNRRASLRLTPPARSAPGGRNRW